MAHKFLKAMARKEGFGRHGTRATRNNNPGNIEWGPFARSHGATRIEVIPEGFRSTPRFAYFPSVELGWEAMRKRLITGMYKGLTVREAISKWAPPIENDTEAYIRFICKHAKVEEDMIVEEILNV